MSDLIPGEFKVLSRQSKLKIEPGDVYLRGDRVYRVGAYDDVEDRVTLMTSNDILEGDAMNGWTPRKEIHKIGLHLCPLPLLEPALQIFELEDVPSLLSLSKLQAWRDAHRRVYTRLDLEAVLPDVEETSTRIHAVPEAQAQLFPALKGLVFILPVLIYVLEKPEAVRRAEQARLRGLTNRETVGRIKQHKEWPIYYVPKRYA